MSALIREARPDEHDAVARVLAAAFEQYRLPADAHAPAHHRAALERYLADLTVADGSEVFVAEHAGALVGAAALQPPNRHVDYAGDMGGKPWPAAWAILRRLAVLPEHRGRGIARLLAEARIERARALGAPTVALHTAVVFEASRAMYRSNRGWPNRGSPNRGGVGWRRAPEYDFFPVADICAEAYTHSL